MGHRAVRPTRLGNPRLNLPSLGLSPGPPGAGLLTTDLHPGGPQGAKDTKNPLPSKAPSLPYAHLAEANVPKHIGARVKQHRG